MFCIVQSYDEIIRIIKSLPSVKGVRLEVRMALFGVEWAASQEKATCVGVVDRWKTKNEMLMIKWEGWNKNKQCSLTSLEKDSDGDFLELKLLPYTRTGGRRRLLWRNPTTTTKKCQRRSRKTRRTRTSR